MDRQQVSKKPETICESCGGSGITHTTYGPFYAKLPRSDRKAYRSHIAARHEAMKLVDRLLARRFDKLRNGKITDAVETLGSIVIGMEEAWAEGDLPTLRANALELAAAATWILEADGAGYITE